MSWIDTQGCLHLQLLLARTHQRWGLEGRAHLPLLFGSLIQHFSIFNEGMSPGPHSARAIRWIYARVRAHLQLLLRTSHRGWGEPEGKQTFPPPRRLAPNSPRRYIPGATQRAPCQPDRHPGLVAPAASPRTDPSAVGVGRARTSSVALGLTDSDRMI